MHTSKFDLVVVGSSNWDPIDDNVDVEVRFCDGRLYTATFFTLKNLESLFKKNETTGECVGGLYFWATEMIIVKRLDLDVMNTTVSNLLRDDEFEAIFTRVQNEGLA